MNETKSFLKKMTCLNPTILSRMLVHVDILLYNEALISIITLFLGISMTSFSPHSHYAEDVPSWLEESRCC